MRDPRRATALLQRAEAEGVGVKVLALDVTDDASVAAAVRQFEDRHHRQGVAGGSCARPVRRGLAWLRTFIAATVVQQVADPSIVARAVVRAAEDSTTPLHVLVGDDAAT